MVTLLACLRIGIARRLAYTLGRADWLNLPLSEAERAELDALGVAGVMAEFKKVCAGVLLF